MSIKTVFGFLFGFSLAVQAAQANELDLQNLGELLKRHSLFSADFQQYTLSESNLRDELSAGRFWIKQPDLFRWETETPFPQLIVSDGSYVWIYDEDLEQVTQRSISEGALTPAAVLGGDLDELTDNFEVDLLEASDQNPLFELKPKSDARVDFQALRILFNEGNLSELLIEDSLGQRSLIMLSDPEFPDDMDNDLFEFTPPEGADLIQDLTG